MTEYEIFLPEDDSAGSCIATFATCLNSIGLELGLRINAGMTEQFGAGWFNSLENQRIEEARLQGRKRLRAWSFYDISWIVNEPFHNTDSPIRQFLPSGVRGFYDDLKDMVSSRNQWFHDYSHHNISNLMSSVSRFRYVSEVCELEITNQLIEVENRLNEIAAGNFQRTDDSKSFASEKVQVNKELPLPQKAVGASWVGEPGSRRLELKESGALIDPELKRNVIQELTDLQKETYLPLWQSQIGKGWLFVDELGQVGGYISGQLRMIGLFGEEAIELNEDPFSKFLLPNTYYLSDGDLIDRSTGKKLDLAKLDKVTASTLRRLPQLVGKNEPIRCTWDGELIHFSDSGPVYVGEIEFSSWFEGHRGF